MFCLFNRACSIVFIVALLAAGIYSQATRTINTVERRIDTMNRQSRDFERDNMGRDAAVKNDPEAAKRSRQIRLEIEEDLNFLQSTYNSTVTALQTKTDFRPGFAAETGRAVRKHASRLRTNLALPDQEGKEPAPPPLPDTDRKSLTSLCRAIYELVTNPMFEGPGTLDAKNGVKVRLDLEAILRLADHLTNVPEVAAK